VALRSWAAAGRRTVERAGQSQSSMRRGDGGRGVETSVVDALVIVAAVVSRSSPMRVAVSDALDLVRPGALSGRRVVVSVPICSAFRTTPSGRSDQGAVSGLPTAQAWAARAGGTRFGPATRTWVGEKRLPAGT